MHDNSHLLGWNIDDDLTMKRWGRELGRKVGNLKRIRVFLILK
jgi:hypothetical protein